MGYIYKCLEHLGNSAEHVGSLKDDYISLQSLSNAAFKADAFSDEECLNCPVFPICGGGCPLDRIRRNNGEDRVICSRYKEGLAKMLPVIYEKIKFQSHE
ncbi:MAG: SPASM domain-containing protein [Muribaculaceae bacterium]|nr:SPASM domain-containing protein [Muribaculaceae bacterium]